MYWTNVSSIVNKAIEESNGSDNVKFILWNSHANEVDFEMVKNIISRAKGESGTSPDSIIKFLQPNDNLILITDGEISERSVSDCDRIFSIQSDLILSNVDAYVINKSSNVDTSVVIPFCRNSSHKIIKCSTNKIMEIQPQIFVSQEDLKLLDTICTPNEFRINYEKVKAQVVSHSIARSATIEFRNKLLQMKARVYDTMTKSQSIVFKHEFSNYEEFQNELVAIRDGYGSDENIAKQFNELINICDGSLKGQLDTTIAQRTLWANNASSNVTLSQVDANIDSSSSGFECPYLFNQDCATLLICPNNILQNDEDYSDEEEEYFNEHHYQKTSPFVMNVLSQLDKNDANAVINNPLTILRKTVDWTPLLDSLDHIMGREMVASGQLHKSPITRKPIVASIVLGNSKECLKHNDTVLAWLFTGGKVLGNMTFWYYVLIELVKKHKTYLVSHMNEFIHHLKYRLHNSYTNASLTGEPEFVNTKVPIMYALGYTLNWSFLPNCEKYSCRVDPLRAHVSVSEYMMQMLSHANNDVSLVHPNLLEHIKRLNFLSMILYDCKNDKKIYERIRGFVQNAIEIDSKIIYVDGPKNEEFAKKTLDMISPHARCSESDMFSLSKLVNNSVALGSIDLYGNYGNHKNNENDGNDNHETNWKYKNDAPFGENIPISKQTCRPYYMVNQETWKTVAEKCWNIPCDNLLSGTKYYINFVETYEKHPTCNEFIIYMYNRVNQREINKVSTLPEKIVDIAESIVNDFFEVRELYDVKEFIKRTQDSLRSEDRIRLEKVL
jgi:hypothetical protein